MHDCAIWHALNTPDQSTWTAYYWSRLLIFISQAHATLSASNQQANQKPLLKF